MDMFGLENFFNFNKICFPLYSHAIRSLYSENTIIDKIDKFDLKEIRWRKS